MKKKYDYLSIYLFFTVLLCAILMIAMSSCNSHVGFEKIDSDFFMKLNKFGECDPMVKDAAYSVLEVNLRRTDGQDSAFNSIIYLGKLKPKEFGYQSAATISDRLFKEVEKLHCGDDVTWILPFSDFDSTYLSGYGQYQLPDADAEVSLSVRVIHTFDQHRYVNYLMQAAQQGELSETEAINMIFVDGSERPVEQHGDVFIERWTEASDDSIYAGVELTMNYSTYLLNGTSLDPLSTMTFQFGRPGQLVPGLSYGISFLKKGERARIYMPSYLAFGEDGSTTGIVPRNTPVYFDVSIIDVKK